MPMKSGRKNPFYAVLVLASTLFVITALAYVVSPYTVARDESGPGRDGGASASRLIDEYGPTALGIEICVMLSSGVLAMVTDRRFSGGSGRVQESRP
jgi:hypothetical protein